MQITQSFASVAASLTGLASNVTGATWTLSANSAGDSLAHKITIRNDSATDHSDKTAAIVGTDANGNVLTETLTLPAGTATVTSAKHFKTVTSVTPSATIVMDTMDIGWAAESVTPWAFMRLASDVQIFNFGFGVTVDSGTPNYTVQHTFGGTGVFDHADVTGETTSQFGGYSIPIQALRVKFTAAGGVTLNGIQNGA